MHVSSPQRPQHSYENRGARPFLAAARCVWTRHGREGAVVVGVVGASESTWWVVPGGPEKTRGLLVNGAALAREDMLLTSFGFLEATLALPGKSWLVIWVWSMRC